MRGKTIVVTGATSGIGEVAAIRLAEQGGRIVFTARDNKRGQATMEKLRRANGAAEHVMHLADLSLVAEQKRAAGEIAREPQIDVLINNAGALFNRRIETSEGLEMTFALNHMSYFTITCLLLDKLKSTPGARIVSTSSRAHTSGKLDFSDLQARKDFRGFRAYGNSKLCNILFTRALSKRLADTGVTANCLHPGFVATRFGDQSGGMLRYVVAIAKSLIAIPEEEGAKTIIYLASSPDVALVSGEYFYQCRATTLTAEARNDEDAERLWKESVKIENIG
jgi:NAD(P)-dependent dehydrogenase (short-subunit alcohol dehydrogenase family)